MAQIFSVNVYQINDSALSSPESRGFSPANVRFRPAASGTTVNGVSIYGIVEELPSGLRVNSVNNYVVETVAQLKTAANA